MVEGMFLDYNKQIPSTVEIEEADPNELLRILDCKAFGIIPITIEKHHFNIAYDINCMNEPKSTFSTVIFLSKDGSLRLSSICGNAFITGRIKTESGCNSCRSLTHEEHAILMTHMRYHPNMLYPILFCPSQKDSIF